VSHCQYSVTLLCHLVVALSPCSFTPSLPCHFADTPSLRHCTRLSDFKNHPTGTNHLITFPTTTSTVTTTIMKPKLSKKRAAPAASMPKQAKRTKVSKAGKSVEPAQTTDVDM
jgi:hypothetical protein